MSSTSTSAFTESYGQTRTRELRRRRQHVVVVRHGDRADDGAAADFNTPLTSDGWERMRRVGTDVLAVLRQPLLFTSPFKRCVESALAILGGERLAQPITVDNDLFEVWEEVTRAGGNNVLVVRDRISRELEEEKEKHPAALGRTHGTVPPAKESREGAYSRYYAALNRIADDNVNNDIVLSCHGDCVGALLSNVAGEVAYDVSYGGFVVLVRELAPSISDDNQTEAGAWSVCHKSGVQSLEADEVPPTRPRVIAGAVLALDVDGEAARWVRAAQHIASVGCESSSNAVDWAVAVSRTPLSSDAHKADLDAAQSKAAHNERLATELQRRLDSLEAMYREQGAELRRREESARTQGDELLVPLQQRIEALEKEIIAANQLSSDTRGALERERCAAAEAAEQHTNEQRSLEGHIRDLEAELQRANQKCEALERDKSVPHAAAATSSRYHRKGAVAGPSKPMVVHVNNKESEQREGMAAVSDAATANSAAVDELRSKMRYYAALAHERAMTVRTLRAEVDAFVRQSHVTPRRRGPFDASPSPGSGSAGRRGVSASARTPHRTSPTPNRIIVTTGGTESSVDVSPIPCPPPQCNVVLEDDDDREKDTHRTEFTTSDAGTQSDQRVDVPIGFEYFTPRRGQRRGASCSPHTAPQLYSMFVDPQASDISSTLGKTHLATECTKKAARRR
eukprot:PhM_4_TR416/c0_g1_i1/m.48384